MIREISSAEASAACASLIARLPDWFGIPESNAAYVKGAAECLCPGAYEAGENCVGMVALRPRYGTTLEIWWMAVDLGLHRTGIGAALLDASFAKARRQGFREMVLITLSEESDDPGYAATRAFYAAQGFRPLVHDHMSDPENQLMWMIRPMDSGEGAT